MRKIALSNLTLETSGMYRCEVSTEGPRFEMVFKSATMNVIGKYQIVISIIINIYEFIYFLFYFIFQDNTLGFTKKIMGKPRIVKNVKIHENIENIGYNGQYTKQYNIIHIYKN